MKKEELEEELIAKLRSLPESQNKINSDAGEIIAGIISEMIKGRLFEKTGKETVLELTLKDGKYICLLDMKQRLRRVYSLQDVL